MLGTVASAILSRTLHSDSNGSNSFHVNGDTSGHSNGSVGEALCDTHTLGHHGYRLGAAHDVLGLTVHRIVDDSFAAAVALVGNSSAAAITQSNSSKDKESGIGLVGRGRRLTSPPRGGPNDLRRSAERNDGDYGMVSTPRRGEGGSGGVINGLSPIAPAAGGASAACGPEGDASGLLFATRSPFAPPARDTPPRSQHASSNGGQRRLMSPTLSGVSLVGPQRPPTPPLQVAAAATAGRASPKRWLVSPDSK